MSRPLALRFLLVFALLFSQLGGLAHGITHTLAEQTQDQSLPHDQACELCAAYAQVGSPLGSNAVHFDFTTAPGATDQHPLLTPPPLTLAAFAARAPPHVS